MKGLEAKAQNKQSCVVKFTLQDEYADILEKPKSRNNLDHMKKA